MLENPVRMGFSDELEPGGLWYDRGVDFAIDPVWLLTSVVVLLLSLSLHEAAHAWTADRLGDKTARLLGRVSLNPLVHVDPIGTILFPVLGLISGGFIFGWARPVPVNTANLRDPRFHHLLIAAAGPASNVVLALFFLIGLKLGMGVDPLGAGNGSLPDGILLFLQTGLVLNVILAVFNLIPVPPLDGSWILAGLLPASAAILMDFVRPYGFLILVLLLYTGVFSAILDPVLGILSSIVYA